MQILNIDIGTTWASFYIDKFDSISPYIKEFIKKKLCDKVYDHRFNRWLINNNYTYYDKKYNKMYIPINFLDELKIFLENYGVCLKYSEKKILPVKPRFINVKMNKKFKPREGQEEAINYLSNTEDGICRKGLALSTGCLVGNTIISYYNCKTDLNHLKFITLKDAYNWYTCETKAGHYQKGLTLSYNYCNRIIPNLTKCVVYSGKQKVWQITLANGNTLTGTKEHLIFTKNGYVPLVYTKKCMVMTDSGHSECLKITYKGVQDTYDICCEDPYHNFIANGIVVHNSGKSFTSIYVMTKLKCASLFIMSGLLEQWLSEMIRFTTLKRNDIYIVKTTPTILKLLDSTYKPKVILASLETIRSYLKYEKFGEVDIPFRKIIERYQIGYKVIDEVHLNHMAITNIDMHCNIRHNVYLTATFTTNRVDTKRIFKKIYPDEMLHSNESENYVNITFYRYRGKIPENRVTIKRGYMHSKFEKQLLKYPTKFNHFIEYVLLPLINSHFINLRDKDEKLLIYFSTINMINAVLSVLKDKYSYLKIASYSGNDTKEVTDNNHIICTTYKKCSVGKDIKKLRTVINTVSTRAETDTVQCLGRLRKLDKNTPEYVDIFDNNISAQFRHYLKRKVILKEKAKSYSEYNILH